MWSKKPVLIPEGLSVVFTWQLQDAIHLAKLHDLKIGGPAVDLLKDLIPSHLVGTNTVSCLHYHNPDASRSSYGCPRKCSFCAVPKIEPIFIQLKHFEPKPIMIDNNILACSKQHLIHVFDKLRIIKYLDFNQGMDARLLKPFHIDLFKTVHWKVLRFAWDSTSQETSVIDAINNLKLKGYPKSKIQVYVLVGYNETFYEAKYRMETLKKLGVRPNPMRFQPLDTLIKDSYCPPQWEPKLLSRFCRYWARQNWLSKVPFEEFLASYNHNIVAPGPIQ